MLLSRTELPLDRIVTSGTGRKPDRDLRESLAQYGLLTPLVVCPREGGGYDLKEGSRRLIGGRALGWTRTAVIIEPPDADDLPPDLKAILVNCHRKNLEQIHLAQHCQRLLDEKGWTQADLARRIGRKRSDLCMILQVGRCPDLVAAIDAEGLAFGAARVLARRPLAEREALLAEFRDIAARDGRFPSVRWIEQRLRRRQDDPPSVDLPPAQLAALIETLQAQGVPIEIRLERGRRTCLVVAGTVSEAGERELERRGERVCSHVPTAGASAGVTACSHVPTPGVDPVAGAEEGRSRVRTPTAAGAANTAAPPVPGGASPAHSGSAAEPPARGPGQGVGAGAGCLQGTADPTTGGPSSSGLQPETGDPEAGRQSPAPPLQSPTLANPRRGRGACRLSRRAVPPPDSSGPTAAAAAMTTTTRRRRRRRAERRPQ